MSLLIVFYFLWQAHIEVTKVSQPFDLTVKMPKTAVLGVHEKQLYVKHPIKKKERFENLLYDFSFNGGQVLRRLRKC